MQINCPRCKKIVEVYTDGRCPICNSDVFSQNPGQDIDRARSDVRNSVWLLSFIAFLPTFVLLVTIGIGDRPHIAWNAITFAVLGYSIGLSVVSIIAGAMCGKGSGVGRSIAFFLAVLTLLNFPIGTIVGIFVIGKLCGSTFTNTLN